MTLSLDHNQRLSLITVLGGYDVRGRELHSIWHLQDALDLDASERQELEFCEETVNGLQQRRWNWSKSIPARSFEVSDADLARIRQAIDEFPGLRASRDRIWLAPILAQLPAPAERNGG